MAACFHKFGIILFKDPRVNHQTNEEYIDMVENYFDDVGQRFYKGETLKDCFPELSYQTGVTPESIEKARDHSLLVQSIPETEKPMSPFPPEFDAKWRYFWPMGERPAEIRDEIPKHIPEGQPMWEEKMDQWGNHMVDATTTAAEMCAIGLGLPADTFTDRMKLAPHLLAPTASDLVKNEVGTAFAGFHYDLNFITCHGKSRYPGLFIWLRNWKKMACKIPMGCLLMQSGIMFESMTGGYILAGYHEVIYTQATKDKLEEVKQEMEASGKKRVLWRISSTMFGHLRYDVDIRPLPEMAEYYNADEANIKYVPMTAHEKLMEELKAINLCPKQSYTDLAQKSVKSH